MFYVEHLYISLAPATDSPQALQLAILNAAALLLLLLFGVITHRTHLNLAIILIVMLLFRFFFLSFISLVKFPYTSGLCLLLLLLSALPSGTLSLKIVKNTYISAITLLFVVKCHFFLSLSLRSNLLSRTASDIFFLRSVLSETEHDGFAVFVSYFQHPFFPETHAHSLALSITLIEEQPSNRTNESARNETHRSPCVIYTHEIEPTTFRLLSAFDRFACHFQKKAIPTARTQNGINWW